MPTKITLHQHGVPVTDLSKIRELRQLVFNKPMILGVRIQTSRKQKLHFYFPVAKLGVFIETHNCQVILTLQNYFPNIVFGDIEYLANLTTNSTKIYEDFQPTYA